MISMNWNYIMIPFNSSLLFCGGDVMCLRKLSTFSDWPASWSNRFSTEGTYGQVGGEGGGYCVGSILLRSPLSPVYVAQEPVYRELLKVQTFLRRERQPEGICNYFWRALTSTNQLEKPF